MSIYSQYKTNEEKEQDGIWINCSPNDDGSIPSFKIARMSNSNKKYKLCLEKKSTPYRRLLQTNSLSEKEATELMIDIFCSSVLMDWKNVQNEKGENLVFNLENAKNLMIELPELYKDLQGYATNRQLFLEVNLEEDSKN